MATLAKGEFTVATLADGATGERGEQGLKGLDGLDGQDGANGQDGRGVQAIEEQYYVSTSGETPTGGTWTSDSPAWEAGKFVWTRSKITYTNGDVAYTNDILSAAFEAIKAEAEKNNPEIEKVKTYIRTDANGDLNLGNTANSSKVQITSEKINFIYNGSVVADIGQESGQSAMNINRANIKQALQIGGYEMRGSVDTGRVTIRWIK